MIQGSLQAELTRGHRITRKETSTGRLGQEVPEEELGPQPSLG